MSTEREELADVEWIEHGGAGMPDVHRRLGWAGAQAILAAGYRKQEPVSDEEVVAASRTISVMWAADPTRPWSDIARAALVAARAVTNGDKQAAALDPKPWLFISDQVFGEFRSDHDEGYNDVAGTWWSFQPRPEFEQERDHYPNGDKQ